MFICPKCKGRATKTINASTGEVVCQQCETAWLIPRRIVESKDENPPKKLKR